MRKVLVLVVMALFLMVPVVAKAADAPAKAFKIGYVNLQKALNDVEDGKIAKGKIKAEFDDKQKKLDIIQNELQTMKTDLDKQRLILSADALKAKEDEYKKKFIELQQKIGEFKNELAMKQGEMTEGILLVLSNQVRSVAKTEGYDLVLEKSQDVVLYSPEGDDITNRLIKDYNAMSGDKKKSIMKAEADYMKDKKGMQQ